MNKNKVSRNRTFFNLLIFLELVGCLGLCYYGIDLFWAGLHNIDTAQNLRYINAEYDLDLKDMNNAGNIWTDEIMYITGMNQLRKGFTLSLVMAFCIGGIVFVTFNKET